MPGHRLGALLNLWMWVSVYGKGCAVKGAPEVLGVADFSASDRVDLTLARRAGEACDSDFGRVRWSLYVHRQGRRGF